MNTSWGGSTLNYLQFSLPTLENYETLTDFYNLKDWDGFIDYQQLKQIYDSESDAVINDSVFNLPASKKWIPNSFEYPVPVQSNRNHPTEKPVPLLENLLSIYSAPGFVILDPTMGSGSTGVAVANLGEGRTFIGCELDPEFYKTSVRRITGAESQKLDKINRI